MYNEKGTSKFDDIDNEELRGLIKSGFANIILSQRRGDSGFNEYQSLLSILPPIIFDSILEEAKKFDKERSKFSKNKKFEIEEKYGKRFENDSNGHVDWSEVFSNPGEPQGIRYLGWKKREILFRNCVREFERPNVMFLMNLISRECDRNGL